MHIEHFKQTLRSSDACISLCIEEESDSGSRLAVMFIFSSATFMFVFMD